MADGVGDRLDCSRGQAATAGGLARVVTVHDFVIVFVGVAVARFGCCGVCGLGLIRLRIFYPTFRTIPRQLSQVWVR